MAFCFENNTNASVTVDNFFFYATYEIHFLSYYDGSDVVTRLKQDLFFAVVRDGFLHKRVS